MNQAPYEYDCYGLEAVDPSKLSNSSPRDNTSTQFPNCDGVSEGENTDRCPACGRDWPYQNSSKKYILQRLKDFFRGLQLPSKTLTTSHFVHDKPNDSPYPTSTSGSQVEMLSTDKSPSEISTSDTSYTHDHTAFDDMPANKNLNYINPSYEALQFPQQTSFELPTSFHIPELNSVPVSELPTPFPTSELPASFYGPPDLPSFTPNPLQPCPHQLGFNGNRGLPLKVDTNYQDQEYMSTLLLGGEQVNSGRTGTTATSWLSDIFDVEDEPTSAAYRSPTGTDMTSPMDYEVNSSIDISMENSQSFESCPPLNSTASLFNPQQLANSGSPISNYKCTHPGCFFVPSGKPENYGAYLRKHLQIHNRSVVFKCDLCPKTFTRRDNERVHARRAHPNGMFIGV